VYRLAYNDDVVRRLPDDGPFSRRLANEHHHNLRCGEIASTVPAFPANAYGGYGEVAIVPFSAVAEYPGHLSHEEGASI